MPVQLVQLILLGLMNEAASTAWAENKAGSIGSYGSDGAVGCSDALTAVFPSAINTCVGGIILLILGMLGIHVLLD